MKRHIRILCALGLLLAALCLMSSSRASAATEGWAQNAKGWWYRFEDGTWPASEWLKVGDNWYYFGEDGYMKTGWLQLEEKWYYLKKSGAMATGWYPAPTREGPVEWFYFNPGGSMRTGWLAENGNWYYLGKSMYHDNVYEIDGEKYCFSTGGRMLTGWWQWPADDGEIEWFYFRESGKLHKGWLKYKDYWYYLDEQMFHATEGNAYAVATIDGKEYRFDSKGHWIP